MAHTIPVVFFSPGMGTETFRGSYAQFIQAAAKDLGLDLRVRIPTAAAKVRSQRPD